MAMAIFSFMLLIIVGGYLNVFKLYQNGLASRDTQQNGRFGMEEMVRTVRESKDALGVVSGGDFDYVCLQSQTGAMSKLMTAASGSYQVLQIVVLPNPAAFDLATCGALSAATAGVATEILSSTNVEVVSFKPTVLLAPTAAGSKSVMLELKIATHKNGLSFGVDTVTQKTCSTVTTSQFCSITTYESSATVRGKDEL